VKKALGLARVWGEPGCMGASVAPVLALHACGAIAFAAQTMIRFCRRGHAGTWPVHQFLLPQGLPKPQTCTYYHWCNSIALAFAAQTMIRFYRRGHAGTWLVCHSHSCPRQAANHQTTSERNMSCTAYGLKQPCA